MPVVLLSGLSVYLVIHWICKLDLCDNKVGYTVIQQVSYILQKPPLHHSSFAGYLAPSRLIKADSWCQNNPFHETFLV